MKYIINDKEYDVQIIRKNNKNTYVRISDDLKIIVTTNYITLKRTIKKILDSNYDKLSKMLNAKVIQHEKADRFFYLGKYYDIIIDDRVESVELGDSYIKIKDEKAFNKWYKNELIKVFNERLMNNFEKFSEITKCPILKIRKMKTRWGVYNRVKHSVTLNSRLLEYEYDALDYVIIHELSHIIHFNHSKDFWKLVEKYCPNYKLIRKKLKE